jgi:hypothetical protein
MPREQVRERSEVIVQGILSLAYNPDWDAERDIWTGNIEALRVRKGTPARSYRIRHDFLQSYCTGWGWEPNPPQNQYKGRFYLTSRGEGAYVIIRYER